MSQAGPTAPPTEITAPNTPLVLLKWASVELLDIQTMIDRIRSRLDDVIAALERA